jgi:hypothetical protein
MNACASSVEDTLLRIGFRHRIVEPNVEAAFEQFARLTKRALTRAEFHVAIAYCLARGLIRDPVRLPEGALQCHWHFELTPTGVEEARRLIDDDEN